jgi:hypothetical protein
MAKGKKDSGNADGAMVEYEPGTAFPGRIRRTTGESSPAWNEPLHSNSN